MKKIKAAKLGGASLAQSLPSPANAENEKYETQGHLQKLTDAFDIMADPGKMKRVKALAGRHHKAIKSLDDLKAARDAYNEKPDSDDI